MCVKAKVPEIAARLGQAGVDRRVIQKHDLAGRIAVVVFVDGFDEGSGHRRTIALQNNPRPIVNGRAQSGQAFFDLTFVVVAFQSQLALGTAPVDTTTFVDALDAPSQIAPHRFASVGKGAAESFNQSQSHGCALG